MKTTFIVVTIIAFSILLFIGGENFTGRQKFLFAFLIFMGYRIIVPYLFNGEIAIYTGTVPEGGKISPYRIMAMIIGVAIWLWVIAVFLGLVTLPARWGL